MPKINPEWITATQAREMMPASPPFDVVVDFFMQTIKERAKAGYSCTGPIRADQRWIITPDIHSIKKPLKVSMDDVQGAIQIVVGLGFMVSTSSTPSHTNPLGELELIIGWEA